MAASPSRKLLLVAIFFFTAENEEIIIYWDKAVLTDRMVRHNRPDIILVEKQKKKALIIEIAVPSDSNLRSTIEGALGLAAGQSSQKSYDTFNKLHVQKRDTKEAESPEGNPGIMYYIWTDFNDLFSLPFQMFRGIGDGFHWAVTKIWGEPRTGYGPRVSTSHKPHVTKEPKHSQDRDTHPNGGPEQHISENEKESEEIVRKTTSAIPPLKSSTPSPK